MAGAGKFLAAPGTADRCSLTPNSVSQESQGHQQTGTDKAKLKSNTESATAAPGQQPAVELRPRRRRWDHKPEAGAVADAGFLRTPDVIIDARLDDVQDKARYCCDACNMWHSGPFQGHLLPAARILSYEDLSSGWLLGAVDASWNCIGCWSEYFQERQRSEGYHTQTRSILNLPPASRPPVIVDNRLHSDKNNRWMKCDRCGSYCPGRARDYHYGSFVFQYPDNSLVAQGQTGAPVSLQHTKGLGAWEMANGTRPSPAEHASQGIGIVGPKPWMNGSTCFTWEPTAAQAGAPAIPDATGQRRTDGSGLGRHPPWRYCRSNPASMMLY